MAMNTIYAWDFASPTSISREEYEDVGSSNFFLGDVQRAFKGSTDFEIWTASSGGTQLTEDTDYSIETLDSEYSSKAGFNVYSELKIINATYQTGSIFITYKILGSYVTAALLNDLISSAVTVPDFASTAEAIAGTDDTVIISPLKMREGFNASGSAPVYACRAWVNFNGVGTVSIRDDGNVSSITDEGTGSYTVNLTTAIEDVNYSVLASNGDRSSDGVEPVSVFPTDSNYAVGSFRVNCVLPGGTTKVDIDYIHVAVFR